MQKQVFVAFSFIAGKEIVKYIVSILSIVVTGLWNKLFDFLISKGMLNTADSLYIWINISGFALLPCVFQ